LVSTLSWAQNPIIYLFGNKPDTVSVYSKWYEPGFVAFDLRLNNISDDVVIISNVNESKLGNYEVEYSVMDSFGNYYQTSRKVVVIDNKPPVLTLIGSPIDTIDILEADSLSGFEVLDNYDKNPEVTITGKVDTASFGIYETEYCATDQSGNKTCLKRSVVVMDRIPPKLTLNGESTIMHGQCNDYIDAGYSVFENYPFGLSIDTFSTLPSVNDSLGQFFLTYVATDSFGNTDTTTRTIEVLDFTPPTIELIGSSKIYIERWAEFEDPGVAVDDFCSNNENITVIKEGNFTNSAYEGTYFLDYSAEDISGNVSDEVRRYIIVGNLDTVGIEANPIEEIEIFPNPFTDKITIQLWEKSSSMDKEGTLTVYNTTGIEVLTNSFILKEKSIEIEFNDLMNGVYIIEININGERFRQAIIKQ
jgi:hypothetical protein